MTKDIEVNTMHSDLVELGWTETQWNKIVTTVTEEAQRGRVAAQLLPVSGPEPRDTVAVPHFALETQDNRIPPPAHRLAVNSDPTLYIQRIAVNVQVRTREAADPELRAALVMFRRAANVIVRHEDALIFQGRSKAENPDTPFHIGFQNVAHGLGVPDVGAHVSDIGGNMPAVGLITAARTEPRRQSNWDPVLSGETIVADIIAAIQSLESRMRLGPFACVLGHDLFRRICTPTDSMVLPRDRILPFLQGPLVRSSTVPTNFGLVIALAGSPIEIVVATDINVRFLQTSVEPRLVFRVAERVALRIQDADALQLIT
jgi:uncharacterized linocin/CFP29 family protein